MIDNGRGIPVDMHEEEGVSAAQVVMTKLHAGGKFDSNSYKVSGGLHGVGVSCVNALSERLELEIWRDGYTWEQEYALRRSQRRRWRKTGKAGTQDRHARSRSSPTHHHGSDGVQLRHAGAAPARAGVPEQGPEDHAHRRARGSGEDARSSSISGGIAEFIKHLNRGKTVLHEKPIYFEGERELPNGTLGMEVALQYNDGYTENVFSFANNINTVDGGTHLQRLPHAR